MESDKYYPVTIAFYHTVQFNYRVALTEEQNLIMEDKDIEVAALREFARLSKEEKEDLIEPVGSKFECRIVRNEPIGRDELLKEFVPSNAAKDLIKKMMES